VCGAERLGVAATNITYVTLCGNRMDTVRHIVADPNIDPRRSAWDDEGGSSHYVGIKYGWDRPTVPIPSKTADSESVRQGIERDVNTYYADFRAAVAAGQVLLCGDLSNG
jgi:hypothetical protein